MSIRMTVDRLMAWSDKAGIRRWGASRRFSPGRVVVTLRAQEALDRAGQDADFFLDRHCRGDWGNIDETSRQANDVALEGARRILSTFVTLMGEIVCVRTEYDRSVTAILTPQECDPQWRPVHRYRQRK